MRIPLSLDGIFSYFILRISNNSGYLQCSGNVALDSEYNDTTFRNIGGNLIESSDSVRVLVSDLKYNDTMVESAHICNFETNSIDTCVFQKHSTYLSDIVMEIGKINRVLYPQTI